MLHYNNNIIRKKKVKILNSVFQKCPADLLKIQKGPSNSISVYLILLI